jgi:small-conductance mechanosensitive channel
MSLRHTWRTVRIGLAAVLLAGTLAPIGRATAQTQPQVITPGDQQQGQQQGQTGQSTPTQPVVPQDITKPIRRLTTAIETAEKALQQLSELEEELGRLRLDVEEILADSIETAEELRPQLAAVRSQIEKLGPAPGKDAPPEAPAIAADRARLTALASELDGAIKAAELTWVRARQLIERITVLRHSIFTRNLLERLPSPLLPGLWRDLRNETPAVGRRLHYLADDWWYWGNDKKLGLAALIAAALVLFIGLRLVVARLTRYRKGQREGSPPTFFERAISVAWTAPLRALPAAAAALLLYGGLDSLDLLYPPWGRAAAAILKAVLVLAGVTALISAVLAPAEPQWRFVALADRAARRIVWLLYGITAVYAIDVALTEISRAFFVPLALSVVQSFAASTAFAALLIGLLLTPFEPQGASASETVSRHTPRWFKIPLWLIALGILAAALLGYVALARFVSQQLVLTGIVVVIGCLGYLAIRAVTREPQHTAYPVGEMLQARFGLDASRRHQLARLTEIALTLALVICALPLLMLQWGFSGADIRDWFKSIVFGLEVGQFRISLARILFGIVLFIALLFATRLFQRWLRERALQQTRMDPSIVNSIDTVVGYAGIALASLLAISYAGFDITSLAIVAGALSIGVGFGLQSIVNNFVSGLILLIERPIKVGDWIVLGDQQGNVRRISVRATEIETFDRASLIIPNSELITGRVLNWTHRDSLGRVAVKVGVSYDADPDRVLALLRKCADDHPDVLRTPAPYTSFDGFGASSLDFSLRVCLADVTHAGNVQTQLRVAILRALREADIEIPFNRVDVNLLDMEGVQRAIAQLVDERVAAAADPPRPEVPAGNGKRIRSKDS